MKKVFAPALCTALATSDHMHAMVYESRTWSWGSTSSDDSEKSVLLHPSQSGGSHVAAMRARFEQQQAATTAPAKLPVKKKRPMPPLTPARSAVLFNVVGVPSFFEDPDNFNQLLLDAGISERERSGLSDKDTFIAQIKEEARKAGDGPVKLHPRGVTFMLRPSMAELVLQQQGEELNEVELARLQANALLAQIFFKLIAAYQEEDAEDLRTLGRAGFQEVLKDELRNSALNHRLLAEAVNTFARSFGIGQIDMNQEDVLLREEAFSRYLTLFGSAIYNDLMGVLATNAIPADK